MMIILSSFCNLTDTEISYGLPLFVYDMNIKTIHRYNYFIFILVLFLFFLKLELNLLV